MSSVEIVPGARFPSDVDVLFLGAAPGTVAVRIDGRLYCWPWDQARAFAVELATMSGRAEVRAITARIARDGGRT